MSHIFSNGYAVVVGVGADLPVTIEDAKAIAGQLCDPARCAYPVDHVRLLTGDKARRDTILSALNWLAEKAGKDDTAVVYFSGHGTEIPKYHLVPFGVDWGNLGDTAITGQEFTERLRSIQAKKLLVLLDCCHAGGQAEAKGYAKSPVPATALDELGKSGGRVVVASSRKDEVSFTGNPYSEFTIALLEAMAGYGAFEKDGYARVLDLALWVGRVVPERTKDNQHPIIKVNDLQDNFALAWYAGGEQTPKDLPWRTTTPSTHIQLDSPQWATWQRMLTNFRGNMLLIEERMSEFVEFQAIPLQLEKDKRQTAAKIADLERQMGMTG
jgi:hypothetical protein